MGLLLASRQSDLARLQAYEVGQALLKKNPKLELNYHFRESLGDINQEDPLWKMPEKGVFTEDFRQGLIDGQWDMVVHSWKDLPIELSSGTEIVATLPRADMRDLFLFKKKKLESVKETKKLCVFSSSPRRIYNLTPFFKEFFPGQLDQVNFESVRGNILTRIRKLMENSEVDGLIVAKAAIDRLLQVEGDEFIANKQKLSEYLKECLWQVLPLSKNPTAAAQGALAVEIASSRSDLKVLLNTIHCQKTWDAVVREREILKSHGGGCHQKIGVTQLHREYGEITYLQGKTEAGEVLESLEFSCLPKNLKKPCTKKLKLFQRESVSYQVPKGVNAHYISRSSALPADFNKQDTDVLWTSGLKTWKTLAARGLWVNGTSESLGELEAKEIESLRPDLQWCRWTHQEAPVVGASQQVATYKLKALGGPEDLSAFEEFFWMSGSQFQRALELYPSLIDKKHYCGPGRTYQLICETLEKHNVTKMPQRLPGLQSWQQATKEKKS